MARVPKSDAIEIRMNVTRYQEFPEDGAVQIWGFVGDFEVSVWLPKNDRRVQRPLLRKDTPKSPVTDGTAAL